MSGFSVCPRVSVFSALPVYGFLPVALSVTSFLYMVLSVPSILLMTLAIDLSVFGFLFMTVSTWLCVYSPEYALLSACGPVCV